MTEDWNGYEPETVPDPAEQKKALKEHAQRKFPIKGGLRKQAGFVLKDLLVVRQIAYGELARKEKAYPSIDPNLMLRTATKLMEIIETVHLKKPPVKALPPHEGLDEDDLTEEQRKQMEIARQKRAPKAIEVKAQ